MKPRSQQSVIVVARERREAERNGVQAGGFRRKIGSRGIGAPHDQRQPRQRRLALQSEQLEHGVEGAAFGPSCGLDAFDVEWNGAGFVRDGRDLGWIDEQDARLWVEETANQPGAGDAVDLRPPPGHPQAGPAGAKRQPALSTSGKPASLQAA